MWRVTYMSPPNSLGTKSASSATANWRASAESEPSQDFYFEELLYPDAEPSPFLQPKKRQQDVFQSGVYSVASSFRHSSRLGPRKCPRSMSALQDAGESTRLTIAAHTLDFQLVSYELVFIDLNSSAPSQTTVVR